MVHSDVGFAYVPVAGDGLFESEVSLDFLHEPALFAPHSNLHHSKFLFLFVNLLPLALIFIGSL